MLNKISKEHCLLQGGMAMSIQKCVCFLQINCFEVVVPLKQTQVHLKHLIRQSVNLLLLSVLMESTKVTALKCIFLNMICKLIIQDGSDRKEQEHNPEFQTQMCNKVGILWLFPGITDSTVSF